MIEFVIIPIIIALVVGGIFHILSQKSNKKTISEIVKKPESKLVKEEQKITIHPSDFKSAFADILDWLENGHKFDNGSVTGVMKQYTDIQVSAIKNFRINLPEEERVEFDKICDNYYNRDEKGRHFFGYAKIGNRDESVKMALENLNKVLHFPPKSEFKVTTKNRSKLDLNGYD